MLLRKVNRGRIHPGDANYSSLSKTDGKISKRSSSNQGRVDPTWKSEPFARVMDKLRHKEIMKDCRYCFYKKEAVAEMIVLEEQL